MYLKAPTISEQLNSLKRDLAYAYRILAHLQYDDHTYTHLSARASESFFIYPFGLRFEEVTPDNLIQITLEGEILEGQEQHHNKTGYMIHGHLYKARPDIQAIFHLHTPESVAVSALEDGLLPLSQWALHFYDKIAYHTYDSLVLNDTQGMCLAEDLGHKNVMLLRHHGLITCGKTLHEALFYAYHLQKACETQCLVLGMNRPYLTPSPALCAETTQTLLGFEPDLGKRDWDAWVRVLPQSGKINF